MSYAAVVAWPLSHQHDRSLRPETAGLWEPASDNGAPPRVDHAEDMAPRVDHAEEILSRVLAAITKAAERDDTEVSVDVFRRTLDFMMSLPADLPVPAVVVESEDEIGLDWDEDRRRVVSLTIDSSDEIGFSALIGREPLYGRVERVDGLPETLRYLLARLYPTAKLL
jgi:hypothetical protein